MDRFAWLVLVLVALLAAPSCSGRCDRDSDCSGAWEICDRARHVCTPCGGLGEPCCRRPPPDGGRGLVFICRVGTCGPDIAECR
jgi:hypothetical protein